MFRCAIYFDITYIHMNYFSLAIKKLVDNFACYSDKLHEDYVYEAFNTIITQTKKGIDL